MKRLCVYLTYDEQKKIDSYIGYMLKELKTCASHVAVVCNETEIAAGREILTEYADDIFCRENKGIDAGGFKDALCSFIGWDQVLQYEELVLVNDSFFGPFVPMRTIFSEMENRGLDFWDLSKHGETVNDHLGYVPEHIQSFFLAIGPRMLHSKEFQLYWENMPYYTTLVEAVQKYELRFTNYFASLGYRYGVLADTQVNDSANCENNYSQYVFLSFEMIQKRHFPFLKRQHIPLNTLHWQTQENLRLALDYIDKETNYEVDLIWQNLIRTFHMTDLQRSFHLQYILSSKQDRSEQKFSKIAERILLAVFVSYENSADEISEYVQLSGFKGSVCIFSERRECLIKYRQHGFHCRTVKSDERIPVLAELGDYDYVCVLQDADLTSDKRPSCIGKSYFYNLWENLIKNEAHVSGILDCFRREKRLGFLTSPSPIFEKYFVSDEKGWEENYEMVRQTIHKRSLNCRIAKNKVPFCVTDHFWIRGNILKTLFRLEKEDDEVLPYLWTYLAQDAGYYSGIVESADYASMNEVNMQYYLQRLGRQVRKQCGDFQTFSEMEEEIRLSALSAYCGKYSRILVYGAGEMAARYGSFIPGIEAYVVSDGQPKPDSLNEKPVKYLSEVLGIRDCGIVLCLDEKYQEKVIPLLKKCKIEHYFCM